MSDNFNLIDAPEKEIHLEKSYTIIGNCGFNLKSPKPYIKDAISDIACSFSKDNELDSFNADLSNTQEDAQESLNEYFVIGSKGFKVSKNNK